MSQRTGDCPVCNKPFVANDDVVTCPDCGAPYHRSCYQQQGECLYRSKHAEGFAYQNPGAQPEPAPENGGQAGGTQGAPRAAGGVMCKSCGTVNDASHIFCDVCGAPLHGAPQPGGPASRQAGPGGYGRFAAPPVDMAGSIDDIPKSDWYEYIGPNAPSYLYRMSVLEQRKSKINFMFSAFFLGPFFFAYRKMWGMTLVSLLLSWAAAVPTFLDVLLFAESPLVTSWLSQATLDTASNIVFYVNLAIQLLLGMFALALYRRTAARRIKKLRDLHPVDADYHAALARKGGTSGLGVALVFGCLFVVSLVVTLALGPEFIDAFSAYVFG